jgi:hypothetical protein
VVEPGKAAVRPLDFVGVRGMWDPKHCVGIAPRCSAAQCPCTPAQHSPKIDVRS